MSSAILSDVVNALEEQGFAIMPQALIGIELEAVLAAISKADALVSVGGRGGARALFERLPKIRTLAMQASVRGPAATVLGPDCFPVRSLLFDKTPTANWKVVWHQDLTIAVRARRDVEGYGPWSSKAGIPHVQPPVTVLERMVAVRVHLDDCGSDNGPLRVLPGSHRAGRIRAPDIEAWRQGVAEVSCVVPRGGLLVMRPLLLHASSPATSPRHRRVIHIEYAAEQLPGGLEWYETLDRRINAGS
jgi:ectoine hydroxylase-related dioxygenase (phytanoyl-CoA dioxygenase family)